jgi:hypothetical protein
MKCLKQSIDIIKTRVALANLWWRPSVFGFIVGTSSPLLISTLDWILFVWIGSLFDPFPWLQITKMVISIIMIDVNMNILSEVGVRISLFTWVVTHIHTPLLMLTFKSKRSYYFEYKLQSYHHTCQSESFIKYKPCHRRHVRVIRLYFLIGHWQAIGAWLGEDPRTNTIKTHSLNILDYSFKLQNYSIVNSEHDRGDNVELTMYLLQESTNMHFQNSLKWPHFNPIFFDFFFYWCSIVDLLMHDTDSQCVNLANQSWSAWKMEEVTTHNLASYHSIINLGLQSTES